MSSCSERGRRALCCGSGWRFFVGLAQGVAAALLVGSVLPVVAAADVAAADRLDSATVAAPDSAPLFAVHDIDWLDNRRQRAVPARLYLPVTANATRPVPLIVFSHGIGGSRNGYSYLGRFWSSQGYASLHLQHVGSDRALWTGNPFAVVGRLQAAAQDGEATARVQDVSFALDQVLAGEFAGRIDAGRIVAAGHSYGANTTLMAVGARVARAGKLIDLRDPRLKAAIVISAPPFYGETEFGSILGGIAVPSLHVTATGDTIQVPGYFSPALDRVSVYEATGGPSKMLAVFAGGSHNIFSDRGMSGGAVLNPQVKLATQALSLAFLKSVFDGDSKGLRDWTVQFAGLLARSSIDSR